jgi:hypothetical protein
VGVPLSQDACLPTSQNPFTLTPSTVSPCINL